MGYRTAKSPPRRWEAGYDAGLFAVGRIDRELQGSVLDRRERMSDRVDPQQVCRDAEPLGGRVVAIGHFPFAISVT